MGLNKDSVYLKIEQNTVVKDRNVTLGDIAKMECTNEAALRQLKQKKLYMFQEQSGRKKQYQVFSILKVIALIHEEYPNLGVVNEGEKDFIVEYLPLPGQPKWVDVIKTVLLCVIIFFGGAFSIMAFNNDIGVTDLFSKLYLQVIGEESSGMTELELFYCIGLAVGILVFFNHVGKKKITHDLTPIQVELRKYEQDVDMVMIENAGRKGHSIDVK